MQFNSNGKLAKFYMWLPPDGKQLPCDLCTYFWGLVGRAFFVFGLGGALALMLIYGIVQFAILIWTHKRGAGFTLAVIIPVAIAIYLYRSFVPYRRSGLLSEAQAVIAGKVDGIKNRYCPRIEWR